MKKKHPVNRSVFERTRDSIWKHRAKILAGTMLTAALGWLALKLCDGTWNKIIEWKHDAERVPGLEQSLSNAVSDRVDDSRRHSIEEWKLWHYLHEDDFALAKNRIVVHHVDIQDEPPYDTKP